MILANKIIKLRKQFNWSQEDLAEKMDVSRQSVSKWESANSIPDLNKIITMGEIFGVSTDYLLKDEIESIDGSGEDKEPGLIKVNLDQASQYVENKMQEATIIVKGVILSICSVIPFFILLALVKSNQFNITGNVASMSGVVLILVMVSIAISFFIKSSQYKSDIEMLDSDQFELEYGVSSIFKEKLERFKPSYTQKISFAISLFMFSIIPLIAVSMLSGTQVMVLMMVIVMLLMISMGIYIIVPVSAKHNAYSNLLKEGDYHPKKRKETERAEKLAAFYWPLVTAIYIGWSLWTMNWGVTWIVWPVAAIAFAALYGLVALFDKDDR